MSQNTTRPNSEIIKRGQVWKVVWVSGSKGYKLYPACATNMLLDVKTASNASSQIDIWTEPTTASSDRLWDIQYNSSSNNYKIVSKLNSSRAVTVSGNSTSAGASVVLGDKNASSANWVFYKVNPIPAVSGITSGQIYYLRNASSGKYMDVKGGGSSDNGTDLVQYRFNGNSNQKFKLERDELGYYSLIPQNATKKAVEITNTSKNNDAQVQIWDTQSYGYMSSQKFKIVKNTSGTWSGTYRLLSYCSDLNKAAVVQGGSGSDNANVIQWNNNGSHNGFWYFEKATISLVGMDDGNFNRRFWELSPGSNMVNRFNARGQMYSTKVVENCSKSEMLATIRDSYFLAIHTHGSNDNIEIYPTKNRSSRINITRGDIQQLNLEKVRCVVLGVCETGKNGTNSILNDFYESGARYVIGWKEQTNPDAQNVWLNVFIDVSVKCDVTS